jgi:hypothetical protein
MGSSLQGEASDHKGIFGDADIIDFSLHPFRNNFQPFFPKFRRRTKKKPGTTQAGRVNQYGNYADCRIIFCRPR